MVRVGITLSRALVFFLRKPVDYSWVEVGLLIGVVIGTTGRSVPMFEMVFRFTSGEHDRCDSTTIG